jgi:hypothetical protein
MTLPHGFSFPAPTMGAVSILIKNPFPGGKPSKFRMKKNGKHNLLKDILSVSLEISLDTFPLLA